MNTLHVAPGSHWLIQAAAAIILFLHIAGGTVGIIAGTVALVVRKGRRIHALAGTTFVISMFVMTAIGAAVAPFLVSRQGEPKLFDSIAALITMYLVATSWMTVKRKAGTTGRPEAAAFAFAAVLAVAAIGIGLKAAASASGLVGGYPANGYYGLGAFAGLAAALDLKVLLNRGITGAPRIARHLWRMCMALFVATGSFFLGQQRVMPESVQGSPLLSIPPLATLALMLFWIVWVRFGKRLRSFFRAIRGRASPQRVRIATAGEAP